MELYFTPVKGKDAFTKNWPSTALTYKEALEVPYSTGVALNHTLSRTCAIDLDDLAWCQTTFQKLGINIDEVLENCYEIVSPKKNTKKAIFTIPEGIELEYMNLPPKSTGSKLELRCGARYDVWNGSEYPGGGEYMHRGNSSITELPAVLVDFWLQCMAHKEKERANTPSGKPVSLITEKGKMSVVYVFNLTHQLETVLQECGYKHRAGKWQSPHSESGSFGLTTQQSYLNPWDVCYSHHASDGELSSRPVDAFEIAAAFTHPDKDLSTAKLIFTHDQAAKLMAIDPVGGHELSTSVHLFNNPVQNGLKTEFEVASIDRIPLFPADVLQTWPEPWPMIWENWKKMPRVLSQELLLPTVLAVHAHMLEGEYITAFGRKPGFYFLTIAPSTAHKDGNSRDAIESMTESMARAGKLSLFFTQLLDYPTSITADTSFIEAFREEGSNGKGHLFWLHTEATRMFQKISGSGNDNVTAVADKIIEVVDGKSISGKQKAGAQVKGIKNPNVQLLFYTQPETIERYITEELVDSGLLGRATITLSPTEVPRTQMFIEPSAEKHEIDPRLAEFYAGIQREHDVQRVMFSDHDQLKRMQDFHQEVLLPMVVDDSLYKMISRIGNTAEQLFCVMVGICNKYDDQMGSPRRKHSVEGMLPLLQYWGLVKQYVMSNYVSKDLDPLASAVMGITEDLLSGKIKIRTTKDRMLLKAHGMVSRGEIMYRIRSRPKLSAVLNARNDSKNVTTRVNQVIDALIKEGSFVQQPLGGSRMFIGIPA